MLRLKYYWAKLRGRVNSKEMKAGKTYWFGLKRK